MKGYRTIAFNVIMTVIVALRLWLPDTELPGEEEIEKGLDAVEAGLTFLWGIGNVVLRAITDTPIGNSTSTAIVRSPAIVGILAIILSLMVLTGCAGTRAAYEAADGIDEIAFVTREHWYALVNEANEARRSGELTGEPLDRAQDIVRGAGPIIDELDTIRRQWQTLKNASTEADLQAAIAAAAANVARLLIIVHGPRPEASLLFDRIEQDLKRWSGQYSFMPQFVAVVH